MKISFAKLVSAACMSFAYIGAFSMPAHADVFSFTTDLGSGGITGTLSGTVNLAFVSPGGSGTGAASSITLTSIPAAFGVLAAGDTATSWADQIANSFTVVNGVVTSDLFFAFSAVSDPSDLLCLNSTGTGLSAASFSCPSTLNELHVDTGNNLFGFNFGGSAGITFTDLTQVAPVAATPEPETLVLLSTGLGSLVATIRRRKHLRG